MDSLPLQEFLAGGVRGLVESQLELDDLGREAVDAWDETGVPPTVLTWSHCLLSCPVTVDLRPKTSAAERTDAGVAPGGAGEIRVVLRYFESPQGGDDPQPLLEEGGR
jgi:hypothetical protein